MASSSEQRPWAGVLPHLTICGGRAAEAIEFYRRAFGAELGDEPHMADDGQRIMHARLQVNGGHLMLNDDFPEYGGEASPPGSFTLHLQVDDSDALWNQAIEAGATERMPLADQFWGDRYGQIEDPFGFRWSIGSTAVPKQD